MTSADYFEHMYATSSDPWRLAERAYEHRKYTLTVASLPRASYSRAFEPACSIGVLTGMLAPRCDELLAADPIAAPLTRARAAVNDAHVTFSQGALPDDWPVGTLDLVVLSEILYYLSVSDRAQVRAQVMSSLAPDGHLVLVHWRRPFEAATATGDEVHAEVEACDGLRVLVQHLEDDFRLEVFGRG